MQNVYVRVYICTCLIEDIIHVDILTQHCLLWSKGLVEVKVYYLKNVLFEFLSCTFITFIFNKITGVTCIDFEVICFTYIFAHI